MQSLDEKYVSHLIVIAAETIPHQAKYFKCFFINK